MAEVMERRPGWPNALSLSFVERLYAAYSADPASVGEDWQAHFAALDAGAGGPRLGPSFRPHGVFSPAGGASVAVVPDVSDAAVRQDRVDQLIRAYRVRGHMVAKVDPLELPRAHQKELDPEFYGLGAADLERKFSARTITSAPVMTLREILELLQTTYCRSIGVQFMHIDDLEVKDWLQTRMEGTRNHILLGRDEQLRILTKLTDAVMLEEFVQKKYLGAKSFSLEGSESLIPLFDVRHRARWRSRRGRRGARHGPPRAAQRAGNIMGKKPPGHLREFDDRDPQLFPRQRRREVPPRATRATGPPAGGKRVHLSLCFNPSHLEYVNPVVEGRVRAKQDRAGDADCARSAGA
jgi:2-oxoglutarate dehydrogenase E1 component